MGTTPAVAKATARLADVDPPTATFGIESENRATNIPRPYEFPYFDALPDCHRIAWTFIDLRRTRNSTAKGDHLTQSGDSVSDVGRLLGRRRRAWFTQNRRPSERAKGLFLQRKALGRRINCLDGKARIFHTTGALPRDPKGQEPYLQRVRRLSRRRRQRGEVEYRRARGSKAAWHAFRRSPNALLHAIQRRLWNARRLRPAVSRFTRLHPFATRNGRALLSGHSRGNAGDCKRIKPFAYARKAPSTNIQAPENLQ